MPKKADGPAPCLWSKIVAELSALETMAGTVFTGVRDQRHFDELEAEATAIGKRLRDAFRAAR